MGKGKQVIIRFWAICKTSNVVFLVSISVITFGLMFALNQVTEFRSDDMVHMLRYGTCEPTENFGDIIYSVIQDYNKVNGRMVAYTITRVLLWWKKPFSSIANALVIAMLNVALYYYGKTRSVFTLILSTTLMYFLNADFDGTCNWISGSSNYIWTILICLVFLVPYVRLLENRLEKNKLSILMIPCMLIAGIATGWTNENIGPTVLIVAIAIMVWAKKDKRSLPIWTMSGVIGLIAGVALMLLAPGNFTRYEYVENNNGGGLLKTLIVRCYYMERAIFNYLFPTLLIGGALLLILVYLCEMRPDRISVIFLSAGILSVGAMILSPSYPPRATVGSMVFFIIPILRIANQIVGQHEKAYRVLCCATCFGYFAFVMQVLTQILYTILK